MAGFQRLNALMATPDSGFPSDGGWRTQVLPAEKGWQDRIVPSLDMEMSRTRMYDPDTVERGFELTRQYTQPQFEYEGPGVLFEPPPSRLNPSPGFADYLRNHHLMQPQQRTPFSLSDLFMWWRNAR